MSLNMSESVTPWTVAHQAPLSMEFSRQEYWSGLPFLTPWELPDPEIKPTSLASPALSGGFFTTEPQGSLSLVITHRIWDTIHLLLGTVFLGQWQDWRTSTSGVEKCVFHFLVILKSLQFLRTLKDLNSAQKGSKSVTIFRSEYSRCRKWVEDDGMIQCIKSSQDTGPAQTRKLIGQKWMPQGSNIPCSTVKT